MRPPPPSPDLESKIPETVKLSPEKPVSSVLAESTSIGQPSPPQKDIMWSAVTLLAVLTIFACGALIFMGFVEFLTWSYPVVLPVGLAMLIALLLDPPVTFLCSHGYKRSTATILTFVGVGVIVALFLTFLLPSLIVESSRFFHDLPERITKGIEETSKHLQTQDNEKSWISTNLSTFPQRIADLLYSALAPVGQAFGFLLGFGFVPIYTFYFLVDRDQIATSWREYVPLRKEWMRDEAVIVLDEIITSLISYFRGQIVVASCNGFLTTVGLYIIGVPDGLFLGVMAGALSVVPFLGIIVSIIPCMLLALTSPIQPALPHTAIISSISSATTVPTTYDWSEASFWVKPILVLVVFGSVQLIESLFVSPRVQSHSTGLHPLTIILGILFWSMVLPGLLGPVMAVPLTCALVVLLRRYVWQISHTRNPLLTKIKN